MLEQNGNQDGTKMPARQGPFGTTVDPVAAGAAGGRASGVARRTKRITEVEERILERGSGIALARVLDLRLKREADVERARAAADRRVRVLEELAEQETQRVDALREQREQLEAERDEFRDEVDALETRVAELEQREAQLRRRLENDDALDSWLREVGETRVEQSCERNGWFDEEADATPVQ